MTPSPKPNPAEIYDSFFVPAMFVPSTAEVLAAAAPRPGERLLDVACGTGIVARTAAALVGESNVVGIDVAPPMLAVARAKAPTIEWRQGNACALDVPDRTFDLVTCQHGIQFFPDRAAACREIRRVLKPGGRAVVAAWLPLDRHPLAKTMMETVARHLGLPIGPLAIPFSMTADDLRTLLRDAGFGSVETTEKKIRARYASADHYVRLSSYGAAAVLPQLALPELERIADVVKRETQSIVDEYRTGDALETDQFMTVAIARA